VGLAWRDGRATPFDAPYYPELPVLYRNVEFQYVFFQADPAAVARILPDPLEASPGGECVAIGIRVPFSSGYGAFAEALVQQKCSLRGEAGWYCSHVWHDGPRGIAAGRETWGTPKIFAELDVGPVEGGYVSRAAVSGTPTVTISSRHERVVDPAELPALTPAWRLKLIPRADGPGAALKQLVDAGPATTDLAVHLALLGRGTVAFHASPFSDLTALRPLSYGPAYYLEASYSEGYGRIALDYLAEDEPGAPPASPAEPVLQGSSPGPAPGSNP
jgi:acetoacetate decarboxylase